MAESLEDRFEAALLAERLERAGAQAPQASSTGGSSSLAHSLLTRGFLAFGAGFNTGLANVLGMPIDAMNAAARAVGLPTADVPVGGSESLKRVMRAGLLPTDAPEMRGGQFVKRVGEEVGAAVVPLGGVGTGLILARRGVVQLPGMLRTMLRPFAEQPVRALATEGALATGGGAGAGLALEVAPESRVAEMAGAVGGSLTTALPISVVQRGIRMARGVVEPFTASGIERRAAAGLQGSVTRTPARVVEELERGTTAVREGIGVTPTTAQASGDPGLLALERSVSRRSAQAKGELEDIVAAERQAVRQTAEQVIPAGRPEAVGEALRADLERATATGARALEQSEQKIRDALARTTDPLEANRLIRQSLAEAETVAQEQARGLFARVGDVRGPVGRMTTAAREMLSSRRKVERAEDMPDAVKAVLRLGRQPKAAAPTILGPSGKPIRGDVIPATESIDELMALRSRLSSDIRQELAQAAPNRLKVSRLEQLKEALDDTVTHDFGDAGPLYEEARQFFRGQVADRFRRGTVAEVLRAGALGEGGRVPESGILNRFFRPGRGAREAAQDFQRVLGDDRAAQGALREAAVQQFADFTVRPDGRFDPTRARQWTTRFRDALREFPDVEAEVRRITQLGDDAARVRIGVDKTLQRFQDSSLRFFLEADPDRAVKAVLGSRNPTEGLRTLVQNVRGSPEALQGLRGAVWAQAITQAETRTFDETISAAFLSPGRLRQFLDTHRRAFVASGLYSPEELTRVDRVVRAAEIVDRSVKVGATGGSDTAANLQGLRALTGLTMPGLWSRFYAIARGVVSPRFILSEIGSRVGGFVLNRISDQKVTALTVQALKDPEVARTLLMRETEVRPLLVARRLHAHLVNLGPVALSGSKEPAAE